MKQTGIAKRQRRQQLQRVTTRGRVRDLWVSGHRMQSKRLGSTKGKLKVKIPTQKKRWTSFWEWKSSRKNRLSSVLSSKWNTTKAKCLMSPKHRKSLDSCHKKGTQAVYDEAVYWTVASSTDASTLKATWTGSFRRLKATSKSVWGKTARACIKCPSRRPRWQMRHQTNRGKVFSVRSQWCVSRHW